MQCCRGQGRSGKMTVGIGFDPREAHYHLGATIALNVLAMNLEKMLEFFVFFAALLHLLLSNENGQSVALCR
jgi:hypothetical protein